MSATRKALVGLHLFNGASAVGGGIALAAGVLGVPIDLLRHTPFDSFVVPGIFLGTVVGASSLIGATALLTHSRHALFTSAAAGAVMIGWIGTETLLIEAFSWLQGLYLLTGLLVVAGSASLAQATGTRENQEVR